MKPFLLLRLPFFFVQTLPVRAQQPSQAVIFVDDMNSAPANFTLSGGGTGTNKWIINNQFTGDPNLGISNTPSQTNTQGSIGQIGTPDQKYLHIYDANLASPRNAHFDNQLNSTQWAKMNAGMCTYGYSEILMTFWWLCDGSANSYGEVYYSVDGGVTWLLTTNTDNKTKYMGQKIWKYTVVKDPMFVDQIDLRFAFKWTNNGAAITDSLPFSVDDMFIIGTTDSLLSPTLSASFLLPNPICQEDLRSLDFYFNLSDTLCVGTYSIELSDSAGNFNNPYIFGYLNNAGPFYGGFYAASTAPNPFPIHTTFPKGNCYKWRINRVWPPPLIQGTASQCFQIIDCPDSIDAPFGIAVLSDPLNPNHICIRSVIDCKFTSHGAYNPPNIYYLELSDSSGSFAIPTRIGSLPSSVTWDPALPPPPLKPGGIGGQIPTKDSLGHPLAPGCNYYLRIVSSDPVVVGKVYGPFCIDQCDIMTNNAIDIKCCITNTLGCSDSIPVTINMYDSTIYYSPGNQFQVQICDATTMAVLYQGSPLGISYDTLSGKMYLYIPNLPAWLGYGLALKMYYMRIISTASSAPLNQLGTIIHITVSGVSGLPLTITGPSEKLCNTTATFTVSPNTPTSKYIWTFAGLGSTSPIPGPSVTLSTGVFNAGVNSVTVTEVSPGDPTCVGQTSAPFIFTIIGTPDATIYGDFNVCVGDTETYSCNFNTALATYYEWQYSGGTLVDSANNQITIYWSTIGNGTVSLYCLNECGVDFNNANIVVLPKPHVLARDTFVCWGDSVKLTAASTLPFPSYSWYKLNDTVKLSSGSTCTVHPDTTTKYLIIADFQGCPNDTIITVHVYGKSTTYNYNTCTGNTIPINGGDGSNYIWSPSTYLNSTSAGTPLCTPYANISYNVVVTAPPASLCPTATNTVNVNVSTTTSCSAGPDKFIIKGKSVQITACNMPGTYTWQPSHGLSDTTIYNPIASPDTTTTYYLRVQDPTGCAVLDTVVVQVVDKPLILLPNAFSPNGDGENDKYALIYAGVKELHEFSIYNRWGEKIFTTTNPDVGWDGKYKDKEQELGTYVYLARALLIDGNETELKGNFMLLR